MLLWRLTNEVKNIESDDKAMDVLPKQDTELNKVL